LTEGAAAFLLLEVAGKLRDEVLSVDEDVTPFSHGWGLVAEGLGAGPGAGLICRVVDELPLPPKNQDLLRLVGFPKT
jgi:hypothetical protein